MSDDLFQIEPTLSPRLKWLAKHGVKTAYHNSHGEYPPWYAYTGAQPDQSINTGEGNSEGEACKNLAVQQKWLMWGEENELGAIVLP